MLLWRLAYANAELIIKSLIRNPSYIIPTILIPAVFYSMFGFPHAKTEELARYYLASFCTFSVFGVALFQFGVGIATERATPWERTLRLLPGPLWSRIVGRLLASAIFSLLALVGVATVAGLFSPAHLAALEWANMFVALFAGIIPITLLGMCVGYWVEPRAALPMTNLIYFPLAYLGGLFGPPADLPPILSHVSVYLPTRAFLEIVLASALNRPWPLAYSLALLVFSAIFAAFAVIGYQRDFAERYS